jgi:A/G-specific adenine glycosylase
MKRADPGKGPSDGELAPVSTATGKAPRRTKPAVAATRESVGPVTGRSDSHATQDSPVDDLNPTLFRRRLSAWYHRHARPLPWRLTSDPYRIWVSEVMLQQTRVAAVVDHYNEFLRRFPTLLSLALAPESDVLAAWSGLGYYRRARMLHKAAQFIVLERDGRLPSESTGLRTLPGIGEYTAAAIASIAFGESIAVVDGNVERVLLRVTGRPEQASAAARAFVRTQAQALVPPSPHLPRHLPALSADSSSRARATVWEAAERIAIAASAHPTAPAGGLEDGPEDGPPTSRSGSATANPPGDHNQAMMELGATICLPRAPLCLQCPVYVLCRTRGEHPTPPRAPQLSRPIAFLLDLRKNGAATEVLLERRPDDAALMPAMYELPPLPLDAVEGREPVLRVRHSITNTNYYVQVFAPRRPGPGSLGPGRSEPNGTASQTRSEALALRRAIPADARDLHWVRTPRLATIPLTGLARKILKRLKVMNDTHLALLE